MDAHDSDSDLDADDAASVVSEISWPDSFFAAEHNDNHYLRSYPDVPFDNTREIRVLGLQPGEFGDEIQCELCATALLDPDGDLLMGCAYEALSYVWGSWDDAKFVQFLGCTEPFPVTHNLWTALRRLRRRDAVRWLWIDQLCIDQSLLDERNHQIQIMGKVYQNASHVVVWLGDRNLDAVDGCTYPPTSQMNAREIYLRDIIEGTTRRWWERIWVVQEIANARKKPSFAFGPFEVSWSWLVHLKTTGFHGDIESLQQAVKRYRALSGVKSDFSSMAEIIGRTQATDARDKVYALLGLVDTRQQALIRPDYSRDIPEIYAEATMASLLLKKSFLTLRHVKIRKTCTDVNDFPSWVWRFEYRAPGSSLDASMAYARPDLWTYADQGYTEAWIPQNDGKFSVWSRGQRQMCFKGSRLDIVSIDIPWELNVAPSPVDLSPAHATGKDDKDSLKSFAGCYRRLEPGPMEHNIDWSIHVPVLVRNAARIGRNRQDFAFNLFLAWHQALKAYNEPRQREAASKLDNPPTDGFKFNFEERVQITYGNYLQEWVRYLERVSERMGLRATNAGF